MRAINVSQGVTVAEEVRHATTLWERARGLLGHSGLPAGEALLLDPCSGIHTFGMAFPIDALFLDRDGVVLHVVREMAPWRMSRYLFSARSVLELPAGTLRRTGTEIGDRVVFVE
ncbi:MAG: DUF192 domain-containing protein [Sphingomonadaceae bacterium]